MQFNFIKNITVRFIAGLSAAVVLFSSCNKDLPEAKPVLYPDANAVAKTLGEEINTNPEYSIFKAAATKVGAMGLLNDPAKRLTVFVPDNAAFTASGIPSAQVIEAMPAATVGAIVQYHIIPGEQFQSADIPETFPNIQLPSFMTIGVLPGTSLALKMSVFPSRRGSAMWANTMPVKSSDHKFKNGVIHVVAGVVAPPAAVLRDLMYNDPQLAFFKAAVARADSGAAGLNKLDSLLGYAVTNMTVLAPDNAAFQTLIFGSVYSHLLGQGLDAATAQAQAGALASTPAVFENPLLFPVLTAQKVKGILAYHFLATNAGQGFQPNVRVLSNNFATTLTPYTTLVNSSVGVHPGVMAQATFTGPFVTSLKFTGMGTFPPDGAPFSDPPASAIAQDKLAVNGVYHIIDKVLLPQ